MAVRWMDDILDAVVSGIEDLLDGAMDGLSLLLGPKFHELLEKAVTMYNALVDASVSLISANPKTLNADLWDIVSTCNASLISVCGILATVLILVNFCTSSLDVRENIRLETMLKLFIKISLSNYFITQNMTIIGAVMGVGEYITGKMGTAGTGHIALGSRLSESAFKNSGAGIFLIMLLTGIAFLVLMSSGFSLLLAAYKRLFKLLLIIPYGGLAFASIAGNQNVSRTAVSYVKFILGTFLEAATMILILRMMGILNIVNPSGLLNNTGVSAFSSLYGNLVMLCFNSLISVGLVLESEHLIHKALA